MRLKSPLNISNWQAVQPIQEIAACARLKTDVKQRLWNRGS
jgi:hypothetical protein